MKSSWIAITAALCCFAPGGSFAQANPKPWPPSTPYDTPADDHAAPKAPGSARPDTPYDPPSDDSAAPKAPGSARPDTPYDLPSDDSAAPPTTAPPGTAPPPPAPLTATPVLAAPFSSTPTPPGTTAAPPRFPSAAPGASPYPQPQPFGAWPPGAVRFGQDQPGQPRGGTDYQLIGGIVSATLGAGMFVLMGVSIARIAAIESEPAFEKYRSGFTADQSVCEQAAAGREVNIGGAATADSAAMLCSQADTFEILTYVSIGAGAALLGLGGYLIFSSETVSGDTAELRIEPRLGPGHGTLQLSLRF